MANLIQDGEASPRSSAVERTTVAEVKIDRPNCAAPSSMVAEIHAPQELAAALREGRRLGLLVASPAVLAPLKTSLVPLSLSLTGTHPRASLAMMVVLT